MNLAENMRADNMSLEELADRVKDCSKEELKEIEREIRLAWAKGCKSEKEYADIVACMVQGSEFNYNSL